MYELVQAILNSSEKTDLHHLLSNLSSTEKSYFLRNEILQAFGEYCYQARKPSHFYHSSTLGKLIEYTHEIIVEAENFWFLVRSRIASQEILRLTKDLSNLEVMTPEALLSVRDAIANHPQRNILEIDLSPFYKLLPSISDSRNIGNGLEFLNRHLCNQLQTEPQHWQQKAFDALQAQSYDGKDLLINDDRIQSPAKLFQQVQEALHFLSTQPPDAPYENFHAHLQTLGFEPGWGNTAKRASETLKLLEQVTNAPNPGVLEAFVSRIPTIFRVVLISIHGWVGQQGVVGKPETMGQVAYVLDQARSLDQQLQADIKLAGLEFLGIQTQVLVLTRLIPNCEGTYCYQRLEKIEGTENAWILRVPFREFNPKVTQNWISKHEIWPYLETFANDAEQEIQVVLKGRPNLIIGNYTDGNLVAFLLARRLQATHCQIAHALEKTKYLFSDLYWQNLEPQYHFSAQFTADLINMNAADFIVTSSAHEIVGTPDTIGQYESYKCFTMPELYHVVDGINLFSPKFNVVPPGINEQIFFPYNEVEKRATSNREQVHDLLFKRSDPHILGYLDNPEARPIFALAPFTQVKNLTGLVEWFGNSQQLQARCNLILITGQLHLAAATHLEEKQEIQKLHEIIDKYHLQGKIRCIGMRLPSADLGEAYRAIADCGGIFVHFALFEAFGLPILEAMISGLPTFATQFGGALDIIQDQDNGFHINPTNWEATAQKITEFLIECDVNPDYWQKISLAAIARVRSQYNWYLHSKQLLLCARIQSFWNYVYQENRDAMLRYLEALFYLIYKPRAAIILEQHMHQ